MTGPGEENEEEESYDYWLEKDIDYEVGISPFDWGDQ